MTAFRVLLGVAGLALLGWGAVLVLPLAFASVPDAISLGGWLGGGVVVHDALIAPAVAGLGLLVARVLPLRWRAPAAAGLVISGVLVLLAVPLVWRPFGGPENPGLHDRETFLGLAVALGLVWMTALIVGFTRSLRDER